jgi:lysophospholipase L1-like esterase
VGYNNDGNENISNPARPVSGPAVVLLDALVLRSAFVRVTVFALATDRELADRAVRAPASSRAHFEPEPARNRWLRRLGITPGADYLPPTTDRVREVYRRMAEVARQNGFQLAVVSMPESLQPGETYRRLPPAYRAAQRAAALQTGVPFVDMNRSFGGERSLFAEDRYHLSHAGEVRLAQGFFEFIKSRGCP